MCNVNEFTNVYALCVFVYLCVHINCVGMFAYSMCNWYIIAIFNIILQHGFRELNDFIFRCCSHDLYIYVSELSMSETLHN